MAWRVVTVLTIVSVVLGACGGDSESVAVEDAWGRPSPSSAANAAFYMTIAGGDSDDLLVSASSDACATTEIHETTMTDGVMAMHHLPSGISVPAKGLVVLEPGGLHVMCVGVQAPLTVGGTVDIDLTFNSGRELSVVAEIREG